MRHCELRQIVTMTTKFLETMKAKFVLILAIFFCIIDSVRAQGRDNVFFDTDSFWTNIVWSGAHSVADDTSLKDTDTLVALISDRAFDKSQVRFAAEYTAMDGALNYLLAFKKDKKWHLKQCMSLIELLDLLPKDQSLVVYTEGYGKTFISGLYRAFAMREQYRVNVLYLDYPSFDRHKNRVGNWRFVGREARAAGECFMPIMEGLRQWQHTRSRFVSVNLFYHSMGNLALMKMIQLGMPKGFNDSAWIDNLVLNAPCVPFRQAAGWLNKISFARQVIVHYNPADRVLRGASLLSGNRKLGTVRLKRDTNNITFVNFNNLVDDQHSYFLDLPFRTALPDAIKHYMAQLLHGRPVNWKDNAQFQPLYRDEQVYQLR